MAASWKSNHGSRAAEKRSEAVRRDLYLTEAGARRDGQAVNIRCMLLFDTPTAAAISPRLLPVWCRRCTFTRSHTTFGLPPMRPAFRARCSPAMVRSDSLTRSCLAITARIASTASLKMPQESKYCSLNDLYPTP